MPYYDISSNKILEAINNWQKRVKEQHKQAKELMVELGASNYYLTYETGLRGFVFQSPPDARVWCLAKINTPGRAYMPKRNCKEGRDIYPKIREKTCSFRCRMNPVVTL